MELDDPVCYCFHISKRKVLNFIRLTEPRVASQLSECGGAGTGCGWCIPYLKRYFEQHDGVAPEDEISATDYAKARGEYIREGGGTPPAGAIPPPEDS